MNPRIGPTALLHGTIHMYGIMQQSMQINCVELRVQVLFYARNALYWCESSSAGRMQNHPNCAFADSASTVMWGAMISLTPCIAPTVERECDLHEYAEFKDAERHDPEAQCDIVQADWFSINPSSKKDCHIMTFPPNKRHQQYVMCPEQDCESLVCMSDQKTSMIESIGLHDHPFWKERVEKFYGWFHKSSKASKDAWTWEQGQHTSRWSGTRGSSKRHQSVPINPADRPNPEEKGLPWRMLEDLDTSMDFLYPEFPDEGEVTEQQKPYMQWIEKILDLDRRTTKDPRLYCAYCDMNNHPRFSCKHAYKHKNPDARHRRTLCAGRHRPFLCPKAQVNGGDAKPNWYKVEYKLAKQESREPDY